jgi:hypothetical protein
MCAGTQYQPVTHEGFVCPGDVIGPACPAWSALVDLVRAVSPETLMMPGPDGCLSNAEHEDGTYPLCNGANFGSYWCINHTAPMDDAAQFVIIECACRRMSVTASMWVEAVCLSCRWRRCWRHRRC